ncbi:MAG: bacteriohopanetetrol glucosamine biosynthesis glycosyltransferase HpnI [Bryobacteraceae bacterium]
MIWLAVPALAAAAYYALAIVAALRWGRGSWWGRRLRLPLAGHAGPLTPLSILKPVHGRDPHFYEAIRSHAAQDYPDFEILFGVSDPRDPALEDIARLQREFPLRNIEAVVVSTQAANAKVGVLAELARRARHPWLLVNDSDIRVETGYLRAVAAPLADPAVGLVTCLYRGRAESWPARMEALGIATEFAPSVMVARLLGQAEFALGSTMALRADALRAAGGFEALADYLADDYQLGKRIAQTGRRIEFAPVVVETDLGAASLAETWRHQVRWSRTIRVSRPGGYYGCVVTHATFWAIVAFAAGQWWIGAAALVVRMTAGALGGIVLQDRYVPGALWLVPFRDLFGFAVWLGGAFGDTIYWRGRKLKLLAGGRIATCAE